MKVSSEFLSHLRSYLDGQMDLNTFREWQLPLLSDRENRSQEDQQFLLTIEARYGELLAGVSEDSFKESLKCLLPREATQSPVTYLARSYVISASTVLVDVSASQGQPSSASGTLIPNEATATLVPC